MKPQKPPKLAVLLLKHLKYFERNEAFAGDLAEEFSSGRSRGWYWRQTFGVIARGMRHNVSRQWGMLLIVFAMFLLLQLLCAFLAVRFHASLTKFGWAGWVAVGYLYLDMLRALLRRRFKIPSWRFEKGFDVIADFIALCVVFCTLNSFSVLGWSCLWAAVLLFRLTWLVAECPRPPRLPRQMYFDDGYGNDVPLRVELSDGGIVYLPLENIVESVYAIGNPALNEALFGRGASLETLRRAVWLGRAGRPQPVHISELQELVQEAARNGRVDQLFRVP